VWELVQEQLERSEILGSATKSISEVRVDNVSILLYGTVQEEDSLENKRNDGKRSELHQVPLHQE
jgi:hypothetical protein